MTKRIVLCADDYGQAPAISRGILLLIQHGRVTATSCLSNSPYWAEHATWLRPYEVHADIGLHFNLTQGRALSARYIKAYGKCFKSLGVVLPKSISGFLDQAVIEAELLAQIDRFADKFGRLPDYIDGHQHVHQFPIIRDALIEVYKRIFPARQAYVRLTKQSFGLSAKKLIISATGTSRLEKMLDAARIPHNQSFAGIYSFGRAKKYPTIFPNFLETITDKGIIMCHPALTSADRGDSIGKARHHEYQYLFGGQFLLDCLENDVTLSRFSGFTESSHHVEKSLQDCLTEA